jgi:hypothetical protein
VRPVVPDDVAQFAFDLRQQSHHDVSALRLKTIAGNVVDVLADLELMHCVAPHL